VPRKPWGAARESAAATLGSSAGTAPLGEWRPPDDREPPSARVEARVDRKAQGYALNTLSKTLGWAGKLNDAYALSQRALDPAIAAGKDSLPNVLARQGRTAAGGAK